MRLPELVLALTWYCVGPGGSTTLTLPEESLTRTCEGTLLKVRAMSPEPSETTTSRLARPWMTMSPEPSLSVTCGPDRLSPDMSPEPVCRLTVRDSRFACTSPDPDVALTGPVRPRSVRLPEPSERTVRLPAGRTARRLNEQLPMKKWHCGDTTTPDGVECKVTVERTSE
jgi:hypothetical protein